jgi:uncharacterized delta-60 repeat protein
LGLSVGWNRYTVGVARFLANGQIDSSFGTGGVAFVPYGLDATLYAVLLQSTGKIVLVGHADFYWSTTKAVIARFDAIGAVDTTFGTNGVVLLNTAVGAASLQTDDSILVALYSGGPAVARFQPNGALDTTFGSAGFASTSNASAQVANAVFEQGDGKILAGWNSPLTATRLTSTGAVDSTFGTGGLLTEAHNDAGVANTLYGFAQQADGRILLAGREYGAFGVQRVSPGGTPDPTSAGLPGGRRSRATLGRSPARRSPPSCNPTAKSWLQGP